MMKEATQVTEVEQMAQETVVPVDDIEKQRKGRLEALEGQRLTDDEKPADLAKALREKEKDERSIQRQAQLESYKQGVALHNMQEQLFWTRNNILVVTQGGLLTAFTAIAALAKDRVLWVFLLPATLAVFALMGVALSLTWSAMSRRSRLVLDASLHSLAAAELALGLVPRPRGFDRLRRQGRQGV